MCYVLSKESLFTVQEIPQLIDNWHIGCIESCCVQSFDLQAKFLSCETELRNFLSWHKKCEHFVSRLHSVFGPGVMRSKLGL